VQRAHEHDGLVRPHKTQAIVNLGHCAFRVFEPAQLTQLPFAARLQLRDVVLGCREFVRERYVGVNHPGELNGNQSEDQERDGGGAKAPEKTPN
jgi:hypothetical protein